MFLDSSLAEVVRARRAVAAYLKELEAGERCLHAASLAVEELLTNVIRHAYRSEPGHPVTVAVLGTPAGYRLVLEDEGPAFDPTGVPEPPASGPVAASVGGGQGLAMVRRAVRRIDYERAGRTNRVTVDLGA